jgi:MFS family permease
MTIVPSFLITGILATILGVITMIWAARFVHRKNGPLVLILLSVTLLLCGGGFFPPVIGIVGGVVATRINAPLKEQPGRPPGRISRFLAGLWPWSLVAFFTWLFGQFVIGHFFNDFLMESGFLAPLLILGLMILSIASGFARDREMRN